MESKPTPLTDAVDEQVTELWDRGEKGAALNKAMGHARRLERALAVAEEALRRVDSTAKSHPYAGNTCGELASAALAQIEELRK